MVKKYKTAKDTQDNYRFTKGDGFKCPQKEEEEEKVVGPPGPPGPRGPPGPPGTCGASMDVLPSDDPCNPAFDLRGGSYVWARRSGLWFNAQFKGRASYTKYAIRQFATHDSKHGMSAYDVMVGCKDIIVPTN